MAGTIHARMHSWEDYRILLAVCEHGSFSKAAAMLGMSQPTASRRIDALERELGARLVVRRPRGVLPTPVGERVIAQARRMRDGALAAERVINHALDIDVTTIRRVRIAASEGFGALFLPRHLALLRGDDPMLAIDLVVDNAPSDLAGRQADLAIRLFRPRQGDLVARRIGRVEVGFFASPAYLARRGTPRRLADLARHDHVRFVERDPSAIPAYMRWLRELVPDDNFPTGASSLLAMAELARAGHGLVLATVAFHADDRRLVRVLPRASPPPLELYLAVHADVRRDPHVVAVMTRLAAILAPTFADAAPPIATS